MSATAQPITNRAILERRSDILKMLKAVAFEGRLIDAETSRHVYASDGYGGHGVLPLAVVLPANVRELARVMRFCFEEGIKIFPRGGGTSLTGGAVGAADGIVLCLSRMNSILGVDVMDRRCRVEAGITPAAVCRAVAAHGLVFAPDPGSRATATVGGTIATDAAGARGLRYGATSRHVVAMRVVLADGEIVEIGNGEEEASGYAVAGLLFASEGQLAVVAEATLRLEPRPMATRLVLLGCGSVASAIACAGAVQASSVEPRAIELFERSAVAAMEAAASVGLPADVEALVMVEIDGEADELVGVSDQVLAVAEACGPGFRQNIDDANQIAQLRQATDAVFTALGRGRRVQCLDIVVPPARLGEAIARIGDISARHGLSGSNFCRVGDGVVRSVLFETAEEDGYGLQAAIGDVARIALDLGGLIAGEHGIGAAKRDLVGLQIETAELNLHQRLKSEFDPEWLLNPGKVYP